MAAPNAPWTIRNAFGAYIPGRWTEHALCAQADPEDFFPEKGRSSANARLICRSCEVREECAAYALRSPIPLHGVWGGMTEGERRQIRRANNVPDRAELDDEHGTEAGARRHQRRGETPCAACRNAANLAWRERRRRDA